MATRFEEITVSNRTVEFTDPVHFMKMAIVPRKDVKRLGDQWKCPGIYVLVGGRADGDWSAYVGKAIKLTDRIPKHRNFEWNRALIVRRSESFDSTEIGWLEGRIYRLLKAGGVDLENILEPQDDTLKMHKQEVLEKYVGIIQGALVLLGYDPEGHQQQVSAQIAELQPEEAKPETTEAHRKLLDVVRAGTKIESTTRSRPATATVDETGIRYQGELFGSLQAAAIAITGYRTNGWSFWGVRSDTGALVRLKDLQGQTQDRRAARDMRNARRQGPTATKRDRKLSPHGDASTTTPKKMSAATVERFLARRDAGATHKQLQEEFRLKKGSVFRLLKEHGRVHGR